VNTLIESDSGSFQGLGFAISIDTAKRIAGLLIAGKKVGHSFVGIFLDTVNERLAEEEKLKTDRGALVREVAPGTPAEKAGIRKGDVVTAVDGARIASADELIAIIRSHDVGDSVKLRVLRGEKVLTFKVRLIEKPKTGL